nr:GDSL-type esterase/lipase family protein [Bradyrhizobium sp. BR 10289]
MIGDSLTEYADWSLLLGRPDVGNQGITGDVSAGVLARLYPSVTGSQVVFLNIGINDPAHFVTAMETQANIRHIVEVLSRGSKVYVQSLILTRRSDLNRYVQVTNEFLQMFCDGKMCTYVDLNARLAKDGMLNESFALDAVHLNENGYLQWAAAIAPLI